MEFLDAFVKSANNGNLWVCLLWLAEWLLAFGFSRFAGWMTSRGGGAKWASFALLPVYESAIVFKKIGLVVVIVGNAVLFILPVGSDLNPVVYLIADLASSLYQFTYVIVIYVLCAKSAGTVTLYRAIGTTLVLAFVLGAIEFFETAGYDNISTVEYNSAHNTTFAEQPSFGGEGPSRLTTSVPGYGTEYRLNVINGDTHGGTTILATLSFWIGLAAAILGVVGMGLIGVKLCPPPRQVGLAAALIALFVILQFGTYVSIWTSVHNAVGFYAWILFGVAEMPLKYYIMLLDSRVRNAPHARI